MTNIDLPENYNDSTYIPSLRTAGFAVKQLHLVCPTLLV
jgi:hypothetical protein